MATPGTLAEFDMILGITQNSVNNGLGVLFNDPLDPTDPDGKTVIDHTMKLGGFRSVYTDDETGEKYDIMENELYAEEIEQPFVDFTHDDSDHVFGKRKPKQVATSVRIFFPIKRGKLFFHRDKLPPKKIDGYRLSWAVDLEKEDISDIHKAVIHPEAAAAINDVLEQKRLSGEHFTVSGLFCLFNAATIAQTFVVEEPDAGAPSPSGTPSQQRHYVPVAENDIRFSSIQLLLNNHYGKFHEADSSRFVLGYGISQTLPPSKESLFVPVDFQFTVTPTPDKAQPGAAMLNFCMFTRSEEPLDSRRQHASVVSNPLAGRLSTTLGARTKATPDTSGVMAFSKGLVERDIVRAIVLSQVPGIWLPPPARPKTQATDVPMKTLVKDAIENDDHMKELASIVTTIMMGTQLDKMAQKIEEKTNQTSRDPIVTADTFTSRACGAARKLTFQYPDYMVLYRIKVPDGSAKCVMEVVESGGEHNLTVDYDSTLSCNPDMKFEKDTARKVTMHFTGSVSTYYRSFKVDASNALEVFKDEAKVNSWTPQQLWETLKRNGGGSDAQPKPEGLWRSEIPYSGQIVLAAGSDKGGSGSWRVVGEESTYDSPVDGAGKIKDGKIKLSRELFSGLEEKATAFLETRGHEDELYVMFKTTSPAVFKDGLSLSMNGLNARIIMPAGEVFDFRGLDSDSDGHIYSHVTYKLVQGGMHTWSVLPITEVAFNTALNRMYKVEDGQSVLKHTLKLETLDITDMDLPFVAVNVDPGAPDVTLVMAHVPFNKGSVGSGGSTVTVDGFRLSWQARLPRADIQAIVDALKDMPTATYNDQRLYNLAMSARLFNLAQDAKYIDSTTVRLEKPDPTKPAPTDPSQRAPSRGRFYVPVDSTADTLASTAEKSIRDSVSGVHAHQLLGYQLAENGLPSKV